MKRAEERVPRPARTRRATITFAAIGVVAWALDACSDYTTKVAYVAGDSGGADSGAVEAGAGGRARRVEDASAADGSEQMDASAAGGLSSAGGGPGSGGAGNSGGSASGGSSSGGSGAGGRSALCGNGRPDPGEQCDDGNLDEEDDCTSLCTDNHACNECRDELCPGLPRCSDLSDKTLRDACSSVVHCMVTTECAFGGADALKNAPLPKCFCGTKDAAHCKDGEGDGPCHDVIVAAFKAAPGDVTGFVDDQVIYNNALFHNNGAGSALDPFTCIYTNCASPENGGTWQCSPAHAGQGSGGAGSGGAGSGGMGSGGAGSGGTGSGGAGSGGTGSGGTGSGGVGSGGTGSGGVASGGAGSGGIGAAGSGGASVCGSGTHPPEGTTCTQCEKDFCSGVPACSTLIGSTTKTTCQKIIDCIRETDCMSTNALDCFCGADQDPASCRNGPVGTPQGAHGECLPEIQAAFPQGSSAADIYFGATNATTGGGAALSLMECDLDHCGPSGAQECVPFCKP